MNEVSTNRSSADFQVRPQRLVSWGAIFAGALSILVLELFFGLIGLSLGAGSVNPATEARPFQGIGIGMAIWLLATTALSVFAGSWVGARLSGVTEPLEGTMHGVMGWSLATLTSFLLLSTALGGVLRATLSVAGNVASTIGKTATEAVSQGMGAVMASGGVDLAGFKDEARALLKSDGGVSKPSVAPPGEIDSLLESYFTRARENDGNNAREALRGILVDKAGMTTSDAEQTIAAWERRYEQAKAKAVEMGQQAEAKAREAGQKAASATATAAFWSAMILLLGLLASAGGGYFGHRRRLRYFPSVLDATGEPHGDEMRSAS